MKRALERLREAIPDCALHDIAEEIKATAFRVTRVGELIGREVAARMGVPFGIVDLSLAPAPKLGDSVGEILHLMGLDYRRLSWFYQGLDQRLTGVEPRRVIQKALA